MINVSRSKAIKFASMLAAILTGGVMISSGQMMEGLGVIAAAFSSTSALTSQ